MRCSLSNISLTRQVVLILSNAGSLIFDISWPPESILAVRGLGLQLSTTRGFVCTLPRGQPRSVALSTSRQFVPLSSISDVVVNEGVWRWQIIYYLVIIRNEGLEAKLEIGFRVSGRMTFKIEAKLIALCRFVGTATSPGTSATGLAWNTTYTVRRAARRAGHCRH